MNNPSPSGRGALNTLSARQLGLLGAALPGLYLLLTSTGNLIPALELYDTKRLLEFVLLLLLFLLPWANREIRDELGALLTEVPRWIRLTLAAVFALGALSAAVNAQSPLHLCNELSDVALLLCLVGATFVLAACRRLAGLRFDQVAVGLIALTAIAVGLQELVGVAAARAAGYDFNFEISLMHFAWPRFFNQVQSWTVPLLAALPLLLARHRSAIVFAALALALSWYVILATGARGSFVAIVAASLFSLLFLPLVRRRLAGWQLIGVILGGLIYAAVLFTLEGMPPEAATGDRSGQQPPRTESRFLEGSLGREMVNSSGRAAMWTRAGYYVLQSPWLGTGPMGYACSLDEPFSHPHNFAIQLAVEWGLPAALLVCLLGAALLFRLALLMRRLPAGGSVEHVLPALLFTGVLAAALHAGLSGVLIMPASQVTGVLICGMLLGSSALRSSAPEPGRHVRPAAILLALALAISSGLTALGAYELRTMQARAQQLGAEEPVRPRMWQDAKVCRLYLPAFPVRN